MFPLNFIEPEMAVKEQRALEIACQKAVSSVVSGEEDADLFVGHYDHFPPDDFLRDLMPLKYFVVDSKIYAHPLPSFEHEAMAGSLFLEVAISLRTLGFPIIVGGSSGARLLTSDCGSLITKGADVNIHLPNVVAGAPFIVAEVAIYNESFTQLLLEGSAWLNEYSGTTYCILIKVFMDRQDFRAVFILLERSKPAISYGDALLKPLQEVKKCVSLINYSSNYLNFPVAELEAIFNFKILQMHIITESNRQIPVTFSIMVNQQQVHVTLPGDFFELAYSLFTARRMQSS